MEFESVHTEKKRKLEPSTLSFPDKKVQPEILHIDPDEEDRPSTTSKQIKMKSFLDVLGKRYKAQRRKRQKRKFFLLLSFILPQSLPVLFRSRSLLINATKQKSPTMQPKQGV
eukprot:Seg3737.2 transcript_id=Seg3737.2/GoldUCD/mRNA.D3Y31 product="hypothetical protein" protein_id=Seg3737.2/GoldUCD/D3Y31